MQLKSFAAVFLLSLPMLAHAQSASDDQLPDGFLETTQARSLHGSKADAGGGSIGSRSNASILGIDSIPNWSGSFYYPGQDSYGNMQYTWQYTMVGNSPFVQKGDEEGRNANNKTTVIGAPVIAVNLDLRNADGSIRFVNGQRLYADATQFVTPVIDSPIFAKAYYDSSEDPTQFTDAVQRAEFIHKAGEDWHTLLRPRVATARTLVLKRGTYYYSLNSDGTCCKYVLVDDVAFSNGLFPATPTDTTSPIGAAENAGDIQTKDISTFLFPNTLLYTGGKPTNCCIVGYHTYDTEPGSASNGEREKRFVLNYSSWVTPGVFGGSFEDVAALSHELSETFNDPFVNNATPWWLSPNGNCQNNEEDGDVIEGLPNAEYPVTTHGVTYHPQNEALLQWFAGVTPSTAIHHAYSYPDTSILTSASVSRTPNCKAVIPQ